MFVDVNMEEQELNAWHLYKTNLILIFIAMVLVAVSLFFLVRAYYDFGIEQMKCMEESDPLIRLTQCSGMQPPRPLYIYHACFIISILLTIVSCFLFLKAIKKRTTTK